MAKEKVVLAYSGGLDTSVIMKWLKENYDYDVIAVCCNAGQKEDFEAIEQKAMATGAIKAMTVDIREEFITDYIWPTLKAGATYENYLLGTAMGRTSWVPAGPRFNYDVNNEQYYLDVYFKGGNSNNQVDQAFGYFSLAKDIDHSITWQTARPDQGSWNAIKNVRLAAEYNYFAVQDGSTDVVLYGDRNDNSFKIPAGVYRIIVNKDMNRMSIVETHLSLTFDPVSGSQVNTGQVVTISSDLEATVHGIAQQYGITRTALITVGDFLGDDYALSKLYDASFSTGYREAKP
jgi:hypothetical protein